MSGDSIATLSAPPIPRQPIPGLRFVLRDQGRSVAWVARKLGVQRPRVHEWMSGVLRPPLWAPERIADMLGVPVSVLLAAPGEGAEKAVS